MENEITFRTSVGGYRKDEVIDYVETINDKLFYMQKEQEEETANYQARIQELEALLKQEEANSAHLAKEQKDREEELLEENNRLKEENRRLQEEAVKQQEKLGAVGEKYRRAEEEKAVLKEKLAREILRLRAENQTLQEKWKEAEANVGSKADYEAVRNAVSEVQYKIAEYVNVINKTQQSLAETYQSMNGIKKKIAGEIDKLKE